MGLSRSGKVRNQTPQKEKKEIRKKKMGRAGKRKKANDRNEDYDVKSHLEDLPIDIPFRGEKYCKQKIIDFLPKKNGKQIPFFCMKKSL